MNRSSGFYLFVLIQTGFGYGSRSDFTKTSVNSPCPTNYDSNLQSPFMKKVSTHRGKTFGNARDVNKFINTRLIYLHNNRL